MRLRNSLILLALLALLAPGTGAAQPSAGTNGKIVFSRDVGGFGQIYAANADGTGATNISARLGVGPYDDLEPSVSPDGTRVAFARSVSGLEHDIFVMNIDGSGTPLRITATLEDDQDPAWSPDGNTIAFSRDFNPTSVLSGWEIWAVGAGCNNPHGLIALPGDDRFPTFSPDGI